MYTKMMSRFVYDLFFELHNRIGGILCQVKLKRNAITLFFKHIWRLGNRAMERSE